MTRNAIGVPLSKTMITTNVGEGTTYQTFKQTQRHEYIFVTPNMHSYANEYLCVPVYLCVYMCAGK